MCFTMDTSIATTSKAAKTYAQETLKNHGPQVFRGIIIRDPQLEDFVRREAQQYIGLKPYYALCEWLDSKRDRIQWLPYEMVFLNAYVKYEEELKAKQTAEVRIKKVAESWK